MRTRSKEFLISLLETASPSGFESAVQRIWLDYVSAFADETNSDSWGNCFAVVNPHGSPRILLGGHADEIGFMVKYISDDGFVYFQGIGGVDATLVRGQRVWIHNRKGLVSGVVGQLAIHLQENDHKKKVPELHDMIIDIGAKNRREAEKRVRVGDAITYQSTVLHLTESVIAARGCDNRVGIFCVAEALRLVSKKLTDQSNVTTKGPCVIALSTIQEENGLYGATMAGYSLKPDVAVIVDVTHATDTPLNDKKKHGDIRLGKGPVLSVGSSNHPKVNAILENVARSDKIPYQIEINPRFSGTDADAIFLQRGGIPCASLGIPNRYMHTPVEVVDLSDIENTIQLLVGFCAAVKSTSEFHTKL